MSDAIRELIRKKAAAAGIDPTHALTMASIETGGTFNPGLTSPTGYKGLFQFGPSEWKAHGGGKDIFDPEANTDAFISYHKEIQDNLKSALGRDPTPQEMYLGWQQGAAGAPKLINSNPDDKAAGTVPVPNILANGGTADMTNRDFVNLWNNKYGEHNAAITGSQYVRSVPSPAMQAADNPGVTVAGDPRTAGDADLGGYGGSPKLPAGGLLAAKTPNYANMAMQSGAGLMAAGSPQQSWQPSPMSLLQPHRPEDVQLPNFLKRQRGLLG